MAQRAGSGSSRLPSKRLRSSATRSAGIFTRPPVSSGVSGPWIKSAPVIDEAGGIGLPGGSVRQPAHAETRAEANRRSGRDDRRGLAMVTEISTDKTKELQAQSKRDGPIRDEPLSS